MTCTGGIMILAAIFWSTLSFADTGTFKIDGMTCGSCVKAIKAKVCNMEGVATCEVKVGEMKIETKEGTKLDLEKIKELVGKAGEYTITDSKITESQKK